MTATKGSGFTALITETNMITDISILIPMITFMIMKMIILIHINTTMITRLIIPNRVITERNTLIRMTITGTVIILTGRSLT